MNSGLRRARAGTIFVAALIAIATSARPRALVDHAGHAAVRAMPQPTHRVERDTVLVDGRLRRFRAYVPASVARGRPPVLAFHGDGGDGPRLHLLIGTRLDALADAHGLIVIYPDGYLRGWHGCRSHAPSLANRLNVDDVAFIRKLLRWGSDRHGTRDDRAFALGYASGGHLVYRLALETPELLAAGSVFAANLPAPSAFDCRPRAAPVPLMLVNGTADTINPYGGGEVRLPDGRKLGRVRSALETAQYFALLAGHGGTAADVERTVLPSRDHGIRIDEHRWTRGAHPVILYTVHGGGHAIPGSNAGLLPSHTGRVARGFDAIGETIRFFLEQWPR